MAHITGGGFLNIPRISQIAKGNSIDYHITSTPPLEELPKSVQTIIDRSNLSTNELYKTFNMGVGLVLISDCFDRVVQMLEEMGEVFYPMGETAPGSGKVFLQGKELL